ncbi:MAG: formate/nitrite transporter family protein [Clostridia bacterium]|nr:formate/nitrite transporter family protein [Clostridia bacterium]
MDSEKLGMLKSSLAAGTFIALGGLASVQSGNPLFGSVIFGAGLVSTIVTGSALYTGKIGYINKLKELPLLLGVLLGNFAIAIVIGLIYSGWFSGADAYNATITARIDANIFTVLGKAFVCGIWVYTAVEAYKRTTNILTIIFPVAAFVISGAEHCVADAFYITIGKAWSPYAVLWLLLVALGNSAGSLFLRFVIVKAKK